MARSVTQSLAADLVAILTDSGNLPVTGLLYTDVTVQYRKEGGVFIAKSLAPTAAAITSGNAETYALTDGFTLDVAVDGGGVLTATFNTADFGNIALATAAEVAAVITTDITGATAADVGGSVVITSSTTGSSSNLTVSGGTANTALGFSTTQVNGVTSWVEVGSGVYEVEFSATDLDTLGSFVYKVTGATIVQYVEVADVVAAGVATTVATVDTCVISGHVFSIAGKALPNATVSARVLGSPSVSGAVGIGDSLAYARTDANGEFFLELARLASVDITIPKMGYRRQLVVPNSASADLFTGIP